MANKKKSTSTSTQKPKKKSTSTSKKTSTNKSKKVFTLEKKEKIIKNTSKRKKGKTKNIIIITILIGMITVLLIGFIFILYIIFSAPEFETEKLYSKNSSVLLDKNGNEFARVGTENRELVKYDDLPQVLVDAIVATEDSRFFQHDGFDIARFTKASLGQIAGSNAGGASTLTMQVVGTAYTDRNVASGLKGIIRKFTDIYMAVFKVEKAYIKEEIIEFYVNSPWLGQNSAWGIEQASQTYFGKSVRDISLPEAAILAGIFNAPNTLNPFYSIENATNRQHTVLNLMYRHGYIDEDQLSDAKSIPVESLIVKKSSQKLNEYQWFVDTVVDEIESKLGMSPYNTSMRIETTLDPEKQDAVNKMANTDAYYKWTNDLEQVAVAITSGTDGSIEAIYGGRKQQGARDLNRATSMHRHPGSTAKPLFDYGPMIEYNNASTGTYFIDEPMSYSNGASIKDFDNSYKGIMPMRSALAQSRNIPALQAFQAVEKEKISNFVHSLGINYGKELYESASIGAFDGVSPVELSAAYGAFARGGYYIEPYSYTKITLTDTNDVIEHKPKKEKVMSEATAYMINSMLMTAHNSGVGGAFTISGTDVAAKTGTSTYDNTALKALGIAEASRDNWTAAYSPDTVITIWYAYDKLTKEHYTTMNRAAVTKNKLLQGMAKSIFPKNSRFEKPSTVVEVEIEKDTLPLQLPSDNTPADMRVKEYFKAGTEPTEVSFRYLKLDAPTGGKAVSNGTTINLSWNEIATPKAIDKDFLQSYFKDNYKISADKYYQKRLEYNNSNIGTVEYYVYLEQNGVLQYVGNTSNSTYTYQGQPGLEYKFVIKSCYSIFKASESNGLEITAKTSGSSSSSISIKLSSNDECKNNSISTAFYNDNTIITVKDINGNDITDDVKILDPIITNLDTNETIKQINTSINGKYKITYYIEYNGQKQSVSRTLTISDTCE